jgi:hypothetical protein
METHIQAFRELVTINVNDVKQSFLILNEHKNEITREDPCLTRDDNGKIRFNWQNVKNITKYPSIVPILEQLNTIRFGVIKSYMKLGTSGSQYISSDIDITIHDLKCGYAKMEKIQKLYSSLFFQDTNSLLHP